MAAPPRKAAKAKPAVESPIFAHATEAEHEFAPVVAAAEPEPQHEPAAPEPAAASEPASAHHHHAEEPAPAPEPSAHAKSAEPEAAAAKGGAGTHGHAPEHVFAAASKSLQTFSAKAMEAYQANAAASMDYMKALAGVRTVSEAIALQSEHMRKQYEALTSQTKELTALAQQVAADAAGPLKDQFGKGFKSSS